jgi:hypothetical protein
LILEVKLFELEVMEVPLLDNGQMFVGVTAVVDGGLKLEESLHYAVNREPSRCERNGAII